MYPGDKMAAVIARTLVSVIHVRCVGQPMEVVRTEECTSAQRCRTVQRRAVVRHRASGSCMHPQLFLLHEQQQLVLRNQWWWKNYQRCRRWYKLTAIRRLSHDMEKNVHLKHNERAYPFFDVVQSELASIQLLLREQVFHLLRQCARSFKLYRRTNWLANLYADRQNDIRNLNVISTSEDRRPRKHLNIDKFWHNWKSENAMDCCDNLCCNFN